MSAVRPSADTTIGRGALALQALCHAQLEDCDLLRSDRTPDIASSARKHGISDERIRYVHRTVVTMVHHRGLEILLGFDEQGNPLEIGVSHRGDRTLIVHAMKMRRTFQHILREYL